MVTYRNPWHKPGRSEYGPQFYETTAKPRAHAGALIYERVPGCIWDVVVDGVCVTQMAGPRGAREAAESLCLPPIGSHSLPLDGGRAPWKDEEE